MNTEEFNRQVAITRRNDHILSGVLIAHVVITMGAWLWVAGKCPWWPAIAMSMAGVISHACVYRCGSERGVAQKKLETW